MNAGRRMNAGRYGMERNLNTERNGAMMFEFIIVLTFGCDFFISGKTICHYAYHIICGCIIMELDEPVAFLYNIDNFTGQNPFAENNFRNAISRAALARSDTSLTEPVFSPIPILIVAGT